MLSLGPCISSKVPYWPHYQPLLLPKQLGWLMFFCFKIFNTHHTSLQMLRGLWKIQRERCLMRDATHNSRSHCSRHFGILSISHVTMFSCSCTKSCRITCNWVNLSSRQLIQICPIYELIWLLRNVTRLCTTLDWINSVLSVYSQLISSPTLQDRLHRNHMPRSQSKHSCEPVV